MSYHEIPDLPDGWVVSTNVEKHISFLYSDGDRRSLAFTPCGNEAIDRWKVIGLAKYAPPTPIFAQNVEIQSAIETAIEVMEAVNNGDEVEPVDTQIADFNRENEGEDQSEATDSNNTPKIEKVTAAGQATFDEF